MSHPVAAPVITACLAVLTLAGCAGPARVTVDPDVVRGREQMVEAIDAAWVRVVASGEYYRILDRFPKESPGAARSYIVMLADCLPNPELVKFPEQPVGLLKKVLDSGEIRAGTQMNPLSPGDTAAYFSPISDAMLAAVLAEIGRNYGKPIRITNVQLRPGDQATTSLLLDDRADFIDQLNATGGDTQGLRRRTSRRFSCTLSAVTQFVHVPEASPLAARLNRWEDVRADTSLRICTGPLATQTTRAFLPNHKVTTRYLGDISNCVREIEAGKADVFVAPLADLGVAGVKGYKAIHTLIVAGTPLWVAKEGIVCPSDDNPKTEDQCYIER